MNSLTLRLKCHNYQKIMIMLQLSLSNADINIGLQLTLEKSHCGFFLNVSHVQKKDSINQILELNEKNLRE